MTKRDWLLLLLGFKSAADRSASLDPIRIQKGMFLLANEGNLPLAERYPFEADNWGPYSRELRRDLDELLTDGIAATKDVPGYQWKRYHLTQAGVNKAREALVAADPHDVQRLVGIKHRVSSLSFNDLLSQVYDAYPDYAVKSLFRK